MTFRRNPDRLFDLLPGILRQRDAERGSPLRALLRIIGEQASVIDDNIEELYDNWFIETCADWVVPYIGDLLGVEPAVGGSPVGRREVARMVALRRRKGTLSVLEELAAGIAGWPSKAVEFRTLVAITQHVRHLRLERGRTVDMHRGDALDRLGGPFDEFAHTVDVRRASSRRSQGRYNLPSLGLFVWPLRPYPITQAEAYYIEPAGRGGQSRFTFSILGEDTPLFTAPARREDLDHPVGELDVPAPIRRRAFALHKDAYYGEGKSLQVWFEVPGTFDNNPELVPVPAEAIVVADLSDWSYRPRRGDVAIDPELGRLVLPPGLAPQGVRVSYYQAFRATIGGGEYPRPQPEPAELVARYEVGPCHFPSLSAALKAWREKAPPHAIVEVMDSRVYTEPLHVKLGRGQSLVIRAAQGARPVLRLLDNQPNAMDALRVVGEDESSFTLDGLLVLGRGLRVEGSLARLVLRHTTLVPGWGGGARARGGRWVQPSLELVGQIGTVRIERSMLGPIHADLEGEPMPLTITDSIVDALGPEGDAISSADHRFARVQLTVERSTVLGRIAVHAMVLADNSVFAGVVRVARRQEGCIRYSYVPQGSRTPRRHQTQPDVMLAAVKDEPTAYQQSEAIRVRPVFMSTRYGTPGYAELSPLTAEEILRGADDGGEMGAFHDAAAPLTTAALIARLDEFIPAGTDIGVFHVTYT